jgi:Ran GTPase-activating protein (RanGAP) involved in mRNA processing and transport
LGDEGVRILLSGIGQYRPPLKRLRLRYAGITGKGAVTVAQALAAGVGVKLEELDLEDNAVDARGADALARWVGVLWRKPRIIIIIIIIIVAGVGQKLEELDLEDNAIDARGADALARWVAGWVMAVKLSSSSSSSS